MYHAYDIVMLSFVLLVMPTDYSFVRTCPFKDNGSYTKWKDNAIFISDRLTLTPKSFQKQKKKKKKKKKLSIVSPYVSIVT